jgi:hypothetical protein
MSSLAKPESARSTMRTFSQRFSDQRNDSCHLSDCTQSGQRIPARKCRVADTLRRAGLLTRPTRHLPRGFSPRGCRPSGSSTIRSNGQLSGGILLPLALRAITRGRGLRVSGARITPAQPAGIRPCTFMHTALTSGAWPIARPMLRRLSAITPSPIQRFIPLSPLYR